MISRRPSQIRDHLEQFLGSYPFAVEVVSGTLCGLLLGAIALGIGIALGDITGTLLLSIGGAIAGFCLGWFLAKLVLIIIAIVVLVFIPKSWWIVLASAIIALVITAVDVAVNGFSAMHAVGSVILFYVLSAICCDIVLAIWRVIIRAITWFWEASR